MPSKASGPEVAPVVHWRTARRPAPPQQSRGEETRRRLLLAAVACLNSHGFGGTTMARVAKIAEVSAGPRQYYFPTTDHLFVAVFQYLLDQQRAAFRQQDWAGRVVDELTAAVDRMLAYSGSPEHIAMLELKLAMKHQHNLRREIGTQLSDFEEQMDRFWIAQLQTVGVSSVRAIAMRRMLAAVARGLAFDDNAKRQDLSSALTQELKSYFLVSVPCAPAPVAAESAGTAERFADCATDSP